MHARVPRTGVPYDIGEGLLDDAEGGEVGAGREAGRRSVELDGEAGARRLLHQFGQPVEAGGRGAGGVARGAQGVEDLADLAERLLAGGLDGGERRTGLLGVGVEEGEA